ncbi:MAG: hypothetical protein U0325_36470 [Polyangiales bacterium]
MTALEAALKARCTPTCARGSARGGAQFVEAQHGEETLVLVHLGCDDEDRAFFANAARLAPGGSVPVASFYDGRYLAVENATGAVRLEGPGLTPTPYAPGLAALLDALTPLPL